MKILVLWADDQSLNHGVRALAQGLEMLAKKAWGPDICVDFHNYTGDPSLSLGSRSILADVGRRYGPIKQKLAGYDLILDSGAGDSFSDIYGLKRIFHIYYAGQLAQRLGVPVIMGPQTIGPFRTLIGRRLARGALGRAATVLARDSQSAVYAAFLGRTVDQVGTDVVFLLPRRPEPKSRDVIVNVNGLLWTKNTHVYHLRYRRQVARLMEELDRYGRTVSLLAHVLTEDDVAINALRSSGSQPEVLLPQSLEEVRQYMCSANLVIGARMHACLNALSTGTPAIAWAYSVKFEPLMRDLAWDFVVDLRSNSCPVDKTIDILRDTSQAEMERALQKTLILSEQKLEQSIELLRATVPVG